jgi:hypothetical protein
MLPCILLSIALVLALTWIVVQAPPLCGWRSLAKELLAVNKELLVRNCELHTINEELLAQNRKLIGSELDQRLKDYFAGTGIVHTIRISTAGILTLKIGLDDDMIDVDMGLFQNDWITALEQARACIS